MSARNATNLHPLNLDKAVTEALRVEIITLTPEIAREWLGVNQGNRNQRSNKIAQYARDMSATNWITTGATISFDWDGRMIDGQHRCEAVIESGVSITVIVVRGLDPRAQDVIDQNAKRSAADALRFNGVSGYAIHIAATANVADAVERGVLTHFGDVVKANLTNSEVLEWYSRNREIDHAVAFASRIARKIKATPAPLAYAIYRTEAIDAQASFDFFNDISEMRTNGKGDPRWALLDGLRRLDERETVKPAGSQLSLVFRAWNAYRAGKGLNYLDGSRSTPQGTRPMTIPEPR